MFYILIMHYAACEHFIRFSFFKNLEKVKNFNGFKVKLLFRRFYIDLSLVLWFVIFSVE